MNAPLQAAEAAFAPAPAIVMLALGEIRPSTTHIQELRRARFKKEDLQKLADSIKAREVMQPVLVRPLSSGYELAFGERRWLAAKLAGKAVVPAIVRQMTDDELLEAQLDENLKREDLHELEEAEGYEELMKLKKISADDLVERFGGKKSRSYVYSRLKLLALCPEAREAFYAEKIDFSKALLIARIGHHDTQRQALRDIQKGEYGRGEMNFRQAHDHILKTYMLRLQAAPFDVDDADLVPKAGSCTGCQKRTGNQRDLFGDVKSADMCTDPVCFDEKRQAVQAKERAALEAQGKKVIAGDQAKKIFTNWDARAEHAREILSGGYVRLNDTTYAAGVARPVKSLLGPDFEPTLIQHPGTGKIVEVATQQAVSAAASSRSSGSTGNRAPKPKKPKGPDVDEALRARLVKLIHEKAPKEFGKAQLLVLAGRLVNLLNLRGAELADVAAAWGWKTGVFKTGGYHSTAKLPKEAMKLDIRGLTLLMFDLVFLADRYPMHRRHVLGAFGINEDKTRALIIDERKNASTAERLAARQKKAPKPSAKVKVKAKAKTALGKRARAAAKPKRGARPIATFMKPLVPSTALAAISGPSAMPRTEVTKKVWGYIKRNGLQDRKQRRFINADAKLKPVFSGRGRVSMFEMTKYLNKHLKPAPKASGKKARK